MKTSSPRCRSHSSERLAYESLEPRCLLATLIAETFELFSGNGFASSPAAGQLDSNYWKATGLSDGDGVYGGNHVSGDFARGLSTGGVTTGGVYAFDVGGNRVLGTQPTGSSMTPGAFELRLQNTTGATVDQWTIRYDIWFLNDQPRSNSIKLNYSIDNTNFVAVSSFDFSTPAAADSAGWTKRSMETTINVSVQNSGLLYFRWATDDESGSGSRDEVGLDNVNVSTPDGGQPATTRDLRIVSYNIANSPQNAGADGNFATIFSAIGTDSRLGVSRALDLLVLQETDPVSIARLESILDGLYSQNYSRVISNNFSGDYFGYIYNTQTLQLLQTENVSGTYTRNPFRALFRPVGALAGGSNFQVFDVHLNATNLATREAEAIGIRARLDALGSKENAFVIGDLNIDSSTEASYVALTASGAGQVFDPINSPGNWHGASSFRSIHTQNPASQMDDRFDFQLINDDIISPGGLEYIPGSYRAFGNNGTHSLFQAITTGSGASSAVLSALASASDHLPMVVDYRVELASVINQRLFYNNSSFDTTSDLNALANNVALMTGQTAAFKNYSNFVKGINGIVLETRELANQPTLANLSQFFDFRIGNSNAVETWAQAAIPNGVVFQQDVDVSGTDLVFLTWADNALRNTWLQVTVLANTTTGLNSPFRFYFGNAVGETGNDAADAKVNLADLSLTRSNQTGFGSALIDNLYDHDRSGRVDLSDVGIVRTNQSGFTPLVLITPGSSSKRASNVSNGDLPIVGFGIPPVVAGDKSPVPDSKDKQAAARDASKPNLHLAGSIIRLPAVKPESTELKQRMYETALDALEKDGRVTTASLSLGITGPQLILDAF